jgi:microcystin degradation protein MlrC
MRVAIGGIVHETHTFSNVPATLESFRARHFLLGEDLFTFAGTKTSLGGVIKAAQEEGLELIPTLYAAATPSGLVMRQAFDHLLMLLLDSIEGASPLDGLFLVLHGAMVVEGIDDTEGYLLERLRGVVGEKTPIVATLDLHANISPLMVEKADILVGYDTYPHIDAYERALEAGQFLASLLRGELRPTVALRKPPLLPVPQGMYTDRPPMKELIEVAHDMEREHKVVTITVAGGFPYSDIEVAGMGIVVTTNGNQELAESKAQELAELAWNRRHQFLVSAVPVREAVRQAMEAEEGPVILVDGADNIGGGAPGDGTVLLRELLAQRARGAIVTIADREAVAQAIEAGVGQDVELLVGGKTDDFHGQPVAVKGRVHLISEGTYTRKGPYMTGERMDMGRTVVLHCEEMNLVLMERKTPPFDAEHLRSLGIEPSDARIIVVKSAIAWRAAFGHIAKEVIDVDTPGLCTIHLESFPYRKIRRPIFPLDEI